MAGQNSYENLQGGESSYENPVIVQWAQWLYNEGRELFRASFSSDTGTDTANQYLPCFNVVRDGDEEEAAGDQSFNPSDTVTVNDDGHGNIVVNGGDGGPIYQRTDAGETFDSGDGLSISRSTNADGAQVFNFSFSETGETDGDADLNLTVNVTNGNGTLETSFASFTVLNEEIVGFHINDGFRALRQNGSIVIVDQNNIIVATLAGPGNEDASGDTPQVGDLADTTNSVVTNTGNLNVDTIKLESDEHEDITIATADPTSGGGDLTISSGNYISFLDLWNGILSTEDIIFGPNGTTLLFAGGIVVTEAGDLLFENGPSPQEIADMQAQANTIAVNAQSVASAALAEIRAGRFLSSGLGAVSSAYGELFRIIQLCGALGIPVPCSVNTAYSQVMSVYTEAKIISDQDMILLSHGITSPDQRLRILNEMFPQPPEENKAGGQITTQDWVTHPDYALVR